MAEVVRVYRSRPVDGVVLVDLAPEVTDPYALHFKTESRLLPRWRPLAVRVWLTADDGSMRERKWADLPSAALGSLIVSTKARTLIEERFGSFVEFLPLICTSHELWAMHVLPSVAAIDETRSRPVFEDYDLSTFEPIGPKVGIQDPFAFFDEVVRGLPVFRDTEWRRGWFMTQPFVDFMRGSGLTGFESRLIYDSELHSLGFDANGDPIAAASI